jgi:hypothetical protein
VVVVGVVGVAVVAVWMKGSMPTVILGYDDDDDDDDGNDCMSRR